MYKSFIKLILIIGLFSIKIFGADTFSVETEFFSPLDGDVVSYELMNLYGNGKLSVNKLKEFIEIHPNYNWTRPISFIRNIDHREVREYRPVIFQILGHQRFQHVIEILINPISRPNLNVNVKDINGLPLIYYAATFLNSDDVFVKNRARYIFLIILNFNNVDFDFIVPTLNRSFKTLMREITPRAYQIYQRWIHDKRDNERLRFRRPKTPLNRT